MSKEQPPKIEKEKEEISIDEIKEFLEQRKDFYFKNEIGDISPLLQELEEQKYENSLRFFERIVGQPTELVKQGRILDLISEKAYPEGKYDKGDKDIKKKSYKQKKEYLRKIVQKLTEERYKDRENFDHLIGLEREEIIGHMCNSVDYGGEKFIKTEERFKKGDYSDLFDYIDFKVAKTLKDIERLKKQGDEEGVNRNLEFLEKLRRARLFFRKHV